MCRFYSILSVIYSYIFIFISIKSNDAARILATVPTPSYSHQVAFRPIWKELARRGHEIVLLTTDPMENIENIRQIDLSFSYDILAKHNYSDTLANHGNIILVLNKMISSLSEVNRKQLEHPEVQEIMRNKSEKFDLLMSEVLFTTHLGLSERFNVPIIGITSLDAPQVIHEIMGNGNHPVINPDPFMPFSYPPTFLQRLISTLSQLALRTYGEFFVLPTEEITNKLIFGESVSSLIDLCKKIDMLFVNVNPIFHTLRAVTPNTITIGGGLHLESQLKPLTEDLKSILDNAAEGFIYFSLGSNVKSSMLNNELKRVFLDTFAELPYKVLWKFETEDVGNITKNVIIRKWFSQTSVLKHPNIKLFITQCGLQSSEEAVMSHVPIVGLPFVADQQPNSIVIQNKGMGIALDHNTLTKEEFKSAILEVINNPKYKKNVIEIQNLISDVEMTGLEKAVWWTEYVIRNNGAKLLKNPVINMPYYQYFLLDVLAFFSLITFIIFRGFKKIISKFLQRKIIQ